MENEMYGSHYNSMDRVAKEFHQEALRRSEQARMVRLARPEISAAPGRLERTACRGLSCLGRWLVALGRRLEKLDMHTAPVAPRVAHPGRI